VLCGNPIVVAAGRFYTHHGVKEEEEENCAHNTNMPTD
jgi:hypothetical protein